MIKILMLITISLFMTACSIKVAKTPNEFRAGFKADPNAFGNGFESYIVKRSLKDVTESIRKSAPRCLEGTSVSIYGGKTTVKRTTTLLPQKDKTTFYLQNEYKFESLISTTMEQPKNGAYVVILDIFKKTKDSVKVDFYKGSIGQDSIVEPIKAWIKGGKGCLY